MRNKQKYGVYSDNPPSGHREKTINAPLPTKIPVNTSLSNNPIQPPNSVQFQPFTYIHLTNRHRYLSRRLDITLLSLIALIRPKCS